VRELVTLHDERDAQLKICPECGSTRTWKDGQRRNGRDKVQRYVCRSCGFRFSDPSNKRVLVPDTAGSSEENGKPIYSLNPWTGNRRVCASEVEAKNLVTVESRNIEQAAGATSTTQDIKGLLVTYEVKLVQRGLAERTVKDRIKRLKLLIKRGANLLEPKSVWHTIDKIRKYNHATGELLEKEWTDATKNSAMVTYLDFAKTSRILIPEDLNFRKYGRGPRKIPFIPLESEIDALIAGSSRKVACFLQLLKETWMRAGEAWSLEWTDIDIIRNIITINNPEKHGAPRQFKVSNKLIAMLEKLPKKSQRVFGDGMIRCFRWTFILQRERIASKLENPRIRKISFHTLRHWGATMEYHRTKDILHVKERLGHRSLTSTLIYTQLISFESDEYHVRTAKTIKEDEELIEAGFEYVTDRDGFKIYRKRK